jgi:hypothetical protein
MTDSFEWEISIILYLPGRPGNFNLTDIRHLSKEVFG